MYSSRWAQNGWKLATTPSARNRGRSAGSKSSMWASTGRPSCEGFASRARAKASSVTRIARSPIACTCTWKPSWSKRRIRSSSASGGYTSGPASPGRSRYGASSAAVRASRTPSA